jgi:hypothetical protein
MAQQYSEIDFAFQKIKSIKRQIKHLKTGEFPHNDPFDALKELQNVFEQHESRLNSVSTLKNQKVRKQAARQAVRDINRFKPILGFILRSTNVRNSFEIYDPLLRISKALLGNDARLILSAEWEFSPFTYPAVFSELPKFVFIGLPASEADNPLIVPLAGHELGHSVWRHTSVSSHLYPKISNNVYLTIKDHWAYFTKGFPDYATKNPSVLNHDLFAIELWKHANGLSARQSEELLCDFLGVRIFGESFLHSFAYLIAPSLGGYRPDQYPKLEQRAHYLAYAAESLSFSVPANYSSLFMDSPRSMTKQEEVLLFIADEATRKTVDDILQEADQVCNNAKIRKPQNGSVSEIHKSFTRMVPASGPFTLSEIVEAGWLIRNESRQWPDSDIDEDGARIALNDLILKSIEVQEFNIKIGRYNDPQSE